MASRSLVTIAYEQLSDPDADLSSAIAAAYGPEGLGILVVDGVPGFVAKREALLPLASRVAALPADALEALSDPASHWNFGWSHGRERLEGDRPDSSKGSFYANPLLDVPTEDAALIARYPHYCRPNLWPAASLPELEGAVKACGALMVDVGLLLAAHCDKYVAAHGAGEAAGRLRRTIAESRCVKSRLLHYFPMEATGAAQGEEGDNAAWCGWHTDHGSLTGLTCAQYSDASGREVPCPDATAGLYIRARDGEVVRATFKPTQLAFQMGQATQIHSGGLLRATPHCVRAAGGAAAAGVARNTFALFMQPNWDARMDAPRGAEGDALGVAQHRAGMTFGDFSEAMLASYH